jgi:hypothetical protein
MLSFLAERFIDGLPSGFESMLFDKLGEEENEDA